MIDKDHLILEDQYSKVGKKVLKEQSGDMTFEAEVEVDLTINNSKSDHIEYDSYHTKTRVVYAIDIEYRSYGIKEINMGRIISIDDFTISYTDYSDGENEEKEGELVIQIPKNDLSDISVKFGIHEYGAVYPTSLEITLDDKLKPILEKTKLIF